MRSEASGFVLEHARDAQRRSRSQAGVARILMLDRKPCRAAAHWSRRLRAQLLAGLAGPAGSLLTPCRCLHQQPRVIDSDEPFSAALSRQGGTVLPRKGRGRQVWGCSQGLMYKFWDGAAVQTLLCCLRCKSTSSGSWLFFLDVQSCFKLSPVEISRH